MNVVIVQTKYKLNSAEFFLKLFYSEQTNSKQKVLRKRQRGLEKWQSEISSKYCSLKQKGRLAHAECNKDRLNSTCK